MSTLTVQPQSSAGPTFIDTTGALDDMVPRFTGSSALESFNGVNLIEARVERNRNDELLAMVAHEYGADTVAGPAGCDSSRLTLTVCLPP